MDEHRPEPGVGMGLERRLDMPPYGYLGPVDHGGDPASAAQQPYQRRRIHIIGGEVRSGNRRLAPRPRNNDSQR